MPWSTVFSHAGAEIELCGYLHEDKTRQIEVMYPSTVNSEIFTRTYFWLIFPN